jgi:5-methylcytosine-specific restriction endonuclease McrA
MYQCDWCGEFFDRRRHGKKSVFVFCSRVCKEKAQSIEGGDKFSSMRPHHYGNGNYQYRRRAFRHYGAKCNRCGYSENVKALQVHHKDGNHQNGHIENLEVLCANCHAIETWA